jgi:lipoic acid synthetase
MHPKWLKVKIPTGKNYFALKGKVKALKLHTVCEEARCPNVGECWGKKTATIMILGDTCTRGCRFCAVKSGNPGGYVDKDEPARVAQAIQFMELRYVVITSVDRDDLEDGGAGQFYNTVLETRKTSPDLKIEILIPDFRRNVTLLDLVSSCRPDVISHNLETVRRLTPLARDARCSYYGSLEVLRYIKESAPAIITKSGFMVGLGETREEIIQTLEDLKKAGCQIVTIGQYLQPTKKHLPVMEYIHPETFQSYQDIGMNMGFLDVVSAPLVRSSYKAHLPE